MGGRNERDEQRQDADAGTKDDMMQREAGAWLPCRVDLNPSIICHARPGQAMAVSCYNTLQAPPSIRSVGDVDSLKVRALNTQWSNSLLPTYKHPDCSSTTVDG